MPIIAPYAGRAPRLHASVFVAENAVVVGDVEVGEGSSIWFGTVVRGDVNHVRIGARTNLQDLTVVHVTTATAAASAIQGRSRAPPSAPRTSAPSTA